jgi:hypothetical protein
MREKKREGGKKWQWLIGFSKNRITRILIFLDTLNMKYF